MKKSNILMPDEACQTSLYDTKLLRDIETQLRELFKAHTYQEIMPPSFEFVDFYTGLDVGFDPQKMFQFIDAEGKNVSLRYDFTVPIARYFALNQKQEKTTSGFTYFGKVYRKEKQLKGRRMESYQIGAELFGLQGNQADQSCLEMVFQVLALLPLDAVVIELGNARFYRRLLELVGSEAQKLVDLLKRKDLDQLSSFVAQQNFPKALAELILALPIEREFDVLSALIQKTQDKELLSSLSELEIAMEKQQKNEGIIIDLGMIPQMAYYNGLMFQVYSEKVAQPIISGGRYDELLDHFDSHSKAIGFCCQMDSILKAIRVTGGDHD
ncbi:ATP phosphoribosyltransferase regulatory subunit [Lactococcus hircilactis]|uniref:ATP phosphoribosyltransferase regulatory subunit n=1 Tax=Lactococcus hircilactis TaxID=1494462 RepID=A0A7X1Z9V2_9LACT|nr:ATP phosphoribosyltransferase regulatory subunit [Lactococcus hircilactis]MQW39180.1 ATP phosphoribosyltransferase regulatory subunit [Lactococcus hircilactis]